MGFSPNDPYEKFNNSDTIFEDNTSQNDHLISCHISVSSILLCPALYWVQHFTVSSTLPYPAHYCVQQNTVSTLTQSLFVHLSHVNMLRSYHAALAKHLCIIWKIEFITRFPWGFYRMIPHEKCKKSHLKHFLVKFTVFCIKGVKGFKKYNFADVKFLFFIRFWWSFLHLIPLNESFQ